MKELKILRNRARCLVCNTTIESRHVHDWVPCPCGAIFVDGGREYLRRGGKLERLEEMSEYD